MTKRVLITLLLALGLIGLGGFFGKTNGQTSSQTERPVTVIIPPGQTINHDYFAAGNTVLVLGTINGDLYSAGGNVTVKGTVNGDVLAAGGTLAISGDVTQDVRVAGGNINITGKIDRNLTVVGGNVDIADSAEIAKSVTLAGGQIILNAPVGRDINFAAGTLTLNNTVGGDVTGFVGDLILMPQTKIAGNLTYTGSNKATIESGAQVAGKTIYHQTTPQQARAQDTGKKTAFGVLAILTWIKIISFISTVIVGFLLIKLLPVYTKTLGETIFSRLWANLGLGLVTLIVMPVILILIFITIIGIPLSLVIFAAYLILLYLAKIFVVITFGQRLVRLVSKEAGMLLGLIIGALVYELLSYITPLNIIMAVLTYSIGLGAILFTKKNYYRTLRTKKII